MDYLDGLDYGPPSISAWQKVMFELRFVDFPSLGEIPKADVNARTKALGGGGCSIFVGRNLLKRGKDIRQWWRRQ